MPDIRTVNFPVAELKRLYTELREIPEKIPVAIASASNATARKVRTAAVNLIQEEIALRQRSINEVVKVRLTERHDNPIQAKILFRDSPRPLFDYPHRFTKKGGLTAQVRKNRPREAWGNIAFKSTVAAGATSSHTGLFRRRSSAKHRKVIKGGKAVWTELPIKELAGPSVTAVMRNAPGLMEQAMELAEQELPKQVTSQIDRFLERKKT